MTQHIAKWLLAGTMLAFTLDQTPFARDSERYGPPPKIVKIDLAKYDPTALDATNTWHLTAKIRTAAPDAPIAPKVDGYNDPNAIRYNEGRMLRHLVDSNPMWTMCGVSRYSMTTKHGDVEVRAGLHAAEFGKRFHYQQCMKFLTDRLTQARSDVECVIRHKRSEKLGFRLPKYSAYDADVAAVVRRLAACKVTEAAPVLIALLDDRSYRVRYAVVSSLGKMGDAAVPGLPRFISYFERTGYNDPLARAAMQSLTQLGAVGVPLIKEALVHRNSLVRRRAVRVLLQIEPMGIEGSELATALWSAVLKESGGAYPMFAVAAFSRLGEVNPEFITKLGKLSSDATSDMNQRECALDVLRRLGKQIRVVRGDLLHLTQDKEHEIRARAVALLPLLLPPSESVPRLVQALDDPHIRVRKEATLTIGRMGPAAKSALPKLIEILRNVQYTNGSYRDDALERYHLSHYIPAVLSTIGKMGSEAAEAAPVITRFLHFHDGARSKYAGKAIETLGRIGPQADVAVPALVEHLKEAKCHSHANRVIKTLGQMGPNAKQAVPALRDLRDGKYRVRDPNYVRYPVAEALQRIAPAN